MANRLLCREEIKLTHYNIGHTMDIRKMANIDTHVDLSVVVPVYNEEGNIAKLLQEIHLHLSSLNLLTEVILVDDGSYDNTWQKICAGVSQYTDVRGLKLSRNFGHQHALLAGLANASGNAVLSMDGDLQHPPSLIPEMVALWRDEGVAIVCTQRIDTPTTGTFKRITSKWFYRLFSAISDVKMMDGSSDFRLMDRRALDALLSLNEFDVFLRGSVQWIGFNSVNLPYEVGQRFSGQSKYTLRKMLRFAAAATLSFSTKPLRLGIYLGFITSIASLSELLFIVIQFFRGKTVPGWASMVGVTALLFSILFILLGIMGGYLASIHQTLQRRPKFIIARTCEKQLPGSFS